MPSSATLLVSALALISQAQAFFILDHAPLVRTRLDPIVNPGAISSHVHNVVGGSRFGKDYSYDDLFSSRCTTAAVSVDKVQQFSDLPLRHDNTILTRPCSSAVQLLGAPALLLRARQADVPCHGIICPDLVRACYPRALLLIRN